MIFTQLIKDGDHKVCFIAAYPSDAERILDAWEEPAVQDSWHHFKPRSPEFERSYIAMMDASEHDYLFLVERAEDRSLIGTVGVHNIEPHARTGRIGLMLFSSGAPEDDSLVEDAVDLIVHFAFERVGLLDVFILVMERDARTKAMLKKLGFQETSRCFPHLASDGRSHQVCIFDKLAPTI
jgi:RimJ/RimL family protein N-acetyltransferase